MAKERRYDPNIKDVVLRLHFQEGRSKSSLIKEYNLNNHIFYKWVKEYREECQADPEVKQQSDNLSLIHI